VADVIKQTLLREKQIDITMIKAGAFRRSAVVPDASFDKVAAQYQCTVEKTDSFTVAQPVAGLGPYSAFAQTALSTPPGEIAAPVQSGSAVYVIRVDGRKEPDASLFQARAAGIRERIYQEKVQEYVAYWYEQVRKQTTIEDLRDAS
jgi:hypothetical protein